MRGCVTLGRVISGNQLAGGTKVKGIRLVEGDHEIDCKMMPLVPYS
jgi:uncharacterized Zn ribbon protein